MRARPVAVLPCLLLVVLAGCGGDDDPGGTSSSAGAAATTDRTPVRTVIRPDRTVVSTTSSAGTTTVSSTTIPGPGTTTATSEAAAAEIQPSKRLFTAVDRQAAELIAVLARGNEATVRADRELAQIRDVLRRTVARANGRGEQSSPADALLADATAAVRAAEADAPDRIDGIRGSTLRHRVALAKAFVGEE